MKINLTFLPSEKKKLNDIIFEMIDTYVDKGLLKLGAKAALNKTVYSSENNVNRKD